MINIWGLKNLMGMASRRARLCEISSHSVRHGMYGSHSVLDGVFKYLTFSTDKKKKHTKKNPSCTKVTSCSLFGSIFMILSYINKLQMGSCTFMFSVLLPFCRGARWLSGRVSDSGARGRGFETYRRRVVSLSKTLYSPKVLGHYPGSDGSVPTWLKNCWLGH